MAEKEEDAPSVPGAVPNPMADAEEGEGGQEEFVAKGTGGSSLGRQIQLLIRKQVLMKRRALKWTLLEIFFPLYPITFLWLIFSFGEDFLPYEMLKTAAVDNQPAEPVVASATSLLFIMSLGAHLGFAPDTPGDLEAAAAVQRSVCQVMKSTAAAVPVPGYSWSDSTCRRFDTTDTMNQHNGWVYMGDASRSVNSDEVVDAQGMYIGVEVGASSLTLRHEEMALVMDMSGDPEEKNSLSAGLLLVQAESTRALLRYRLCPAQVAACDAACHALLAAGSCGGNSFCAGVLSCTAAKTPAQQAALARADPGTLYMQKFPVLETIKLVNMRKLLYPMLFLTVLFINLQASLTQLGQEKERGIKNALTLKGMKREAFWSTWILTEGAVMTVSVCVVTVAAAIVGVIEHTPMYHFFYNMWIFGLSLISMAFVLSAFFTQAKTMFIVAAVMLILFAVIAYVVELIMIRLDWPYASVLGAFLFSPNAYGHLLWTLSDGELKGTGWEEGLTILDWGHENDYYYEAHIMMHVDILIYLVLCLFFDKLVGDPFSFGRGPGGNAEKAVNASGQGLTVRGLAKEFTWKEKADGWAGVAGVKVSKSVKAVDGLDLDVDENTIFCLLGHNGAGKTTAMTLLAGLIAPDAGSAMVGGYDVIADRDEMRENLGMCPQHDILYDELSAKEQLLLYGSMQGLSDDEADSEANRLLDAVGMMAKSGDLASQMSGGQRRRLSLAVSLIGKPKVAFLDEPTTGMDPHNRQLCWKLLQVEKQTCTVLLTTHSMEEADLLGDSLGVMDKGKMQAFGTSLELKHQHGSGYGLNCVKDSKDVSSDAIAQLVTSKVSGAQMRTDIGTELTFSLPIDQADSFPGLFRSMDSQKSSLGLATFGLTQTSLEEVFLNLASSGEHAEETTGTATTADRVDNPVADEPLPQFECQPSACGQFSAVIYQVFLQAARYPIAVVYLVIMPLLFTWLACWLVPYMKDGDPATIDMLNVNWDDHQRAACSAHMWAGSLATSNTPGALTALPANLEYPTCAQLVTALQRETHDLQIYPGYDGLHHPYIAYCRGNSTADPAGWGKTTTNAPVPSMSTVMLYNATEMYSSRAAMSCVLNQVSADAGVAPITVRYKDYKIKASANSLGGGAIAGGILANIFMILSGYYCEEQIRIRVERVKEMMLLCGLPRPVYWVSYFVSHYTLFVTTWILCYLFMLIDGDIGMVANSSAVPLFIHVLSAGPAIITYGYILSFATDDILAAQQWINEYLNVTFALPLMMLIFAIKEEDTRADVENFFFILPGFVLYKGMSVIETASVNGEPFSASDTFDWDKGLIKWTLFHWLQTALFCIAIFVLDGKLIQKLTGPTVSGEVGIDEDQELLAELLPPVEGAKMDSKPDNSAHANLLSKCYALEGGGSVQAVRETSIGVKPNEVLGLLGPNGAGKTTTMSMMSGIETIDQGEAWINDKSITTELGEARMLLGLCPQFDALMGNLTAREHLVIFAKIRGVPSDMINVLVDRTIRDMDLTLKAEERTSSYSGGNKRKLSVALSMVASPTVNFLDEPSTGMDPETRRFMWDYIASVREGRALILTTHSMEEADALCSNIGIMIRGQLRALGSSQELKSNYGEGYQITIRLGGTGADVDEPFAKVSELINSLSSSVKAEDSATMVKRYEVPAGEVSLAEIFELVNKNAASHGIVDFSVSQTTLEDVFLRLARMGDVRKEG